MMLSNSTSDCTVILCQCVERINDFYLLFILFYYMRLFTYEISLLDFLLKENADLQRLFAISA
jgi:hypothetical protein